MPLFNRVNKWRSFRSHLPILAPFLSQYEQPACLCQMPRNTLAICFVILRFMWAVLRKFIGRRMQCKTLPISSYYRD